MCVGDTIHDSNSRQDLRILAGAIRYRPPRFMFILVSLGCLSGLPFYSRFLTKEEVLLDSRGSFSGVAVFMLLGRALFSAIYSARILGVKEVRSSCVDALGGGLSQVFMI